MKLYKRHIWLSLFAKKEKKYYEDQSSISQEERQSLYQVYLEDVKKEEAQLIGIRQLLEQSALQDKLTQVWKAISKNRAVLSNID